MKKETEQKAPEIKKNWTQPELSILQTDIIQSGFFTYKEDTDTKNS